MVCQTIIEIAILELNNDVVNTFMHTITALNVLAMDQCWTKDQRSTAVAKDFQTTAKV